MLIEKYINWMLPIRLQNDPLDLKAINWAWLVCAYLQLITTFIFFIVYSSVLYIDLFSSLSLAISTIVQFYNVLLLRKKGHLAINLNLGNLALVFAVILPAFRNGGIAFPPISWVITGVVFAAFLKEKKYFIWWILIFTILISFLFVFAPDASRQSVLQFQVDSFIHRFFSLLVISFQVYVFAFVQNLITEEKERMRKYQETLLSENKNLLRIISHDVANPLTILGLSLKKISSQDDVNKKNLERASIAVSTIGDILTEVRNWQSLRDGKTVINLEETCLDDLIKTTLLNLNEKIKDKNINIKYKNNNIKVLVDSKLFINQVLSNLLTNAIKFSFENDHIEIDAIDNENKIMIKVIDHGIGMPDEIRENLFSSDIPTSRLGTKGEKGTGFGMLIIKEALDKMNGKIFVQSNSVEKMQKNHGTIFSIEFQKIITKA